MSSYKKDTDFGQILDVKPAIHPPFSAAAWFAFPHTVPRKTGALAPLRFRPPCIRETIPPMNLLD